MNRRVLVAVSVALVLTAMVAGGWVWHESTRQQVCRGTSWIGVDDHGKVIRGCGTAPPMAH
jgi:hypothetical protein